MAHIVLVEDERALSNLIADGLRSAGHTVEPIFDGETALHRLTRPGPPDPDLIVLDLMLPGLDGLEVCRRVRQIRITPILVLTAKATELDTVLGLELGADDYLVKPVSIRELQARIAAILRRVEMMRHQSQTHDGGQWPVLDGDLRVDPLGREVMVDERVVTLTAKEFDLLHLLVSNPGRVFNRAYLLDRLWGNDYTGMDRTVDTHILRLRRKLGGTGSPADRITTLWGVGYKYEQATRRGGETAARRDAASARPDKTR